MSSVIASSLSWRAPRVGRLGSKHGSIRSFWAASRFAWATCNWTPPSAPLWKPSVTKSLRVAVMRFKADEISSVLQSEIEQYRSKLEVHEVGRVLEVGDGIARVYGLSGAMAGEMVEFTRTGVRGVVFNLEENSVGLIILGEYLEIEEGDEVRTTSELLQVPVGDAVVGRVVNPLGVPLDGKGPIVTTLARPVETIAPGVAGRQPVNQPLQTGIKAIDSMTPIGRGQRELIIGDRKT